MNQKQNQIIPDQCAEPIVKKIQIVHYPINTEIDELQTLKNQGEKNEVIRDEQSDENIENIQPELENGSITYFYFQRLMIIEYACSIFSTITIILSMLYYDNDFHDGNKNQQMISQTILWLIFFGSLILLTLMILRIKFKSDLKLKQQFNRNSQISIIHKLIKFSTLIQIFIILLQPYPFSNHIEFQSNSLYSGRQFYYKLNHIFCLTILFRLFIVVRLLIRQSKFASTRAIRLGRMFGCKTGYYYTIKCIFKEEPMKLIVLAFFISVFFIAWALRIAERPLVIAMIQYNDPPQIITGFDNYFNCLWCVVITMTTVGYGDYKPFTFLGRGLIIFIASWGIFSISMMVVVLTNQFSLEPLEQKVLTILKCISTTQDLRDTAASIITLVTRLKYKKYDGKHKKEGFSIDKTYKIGQQKRMVLKSQSKKLAVIQRNLRSLYQTGDFNEEMARMFNQLCQDLKAVNENNNKINQYVNLKFEMMINAKIKTLIIQNIKQQDQ